MVTSGNKKHDSAIEPTWDQSPKDLLVIQGNRREITYFTLFKLVEIPH